jgi:hypothetical protein
LCLTCVILDIYITWGIYTVDMLSYSTLLTNTIVDNYSDTNILNVLDDKQTRFP